MESIGKNNYVSPSKSNISSSKIKECILIFIKKSTLYKEAREAALKDIQEHIDKYKYKREINKSELASKLPEYDENKDPYLYRGISINLETLKKIIFKEGLKINKTEEERIYFTSMRYYNKAVISYAKGDEDTLSVIFQISNSLLRRYHIDVGGAGDNISVDQDIPAKLIRKTNIFLINYANGTLTEIKGNL